MSTNSSVVLRFMAQGQSTITGIFDNLKKQKQDLEKGVNIPIDADDKKATTKLDDVNHMLADLAKKHATATADVNDSAGKAKLLQMGLTLKRLNDYVAKPTISVTGLAKAEISLLKFDAELDAIGKKNEKANVSAGGVAGLPTKSPNASPTVAGLGGGLVNPGTILTALAAIPFAAQAAGMAITFGLGGAIAGVAILAASRSNNVKKSFDNLRNSANHDLTQIGDPFKGVMESIFTTAQSTLTKLTPIFAGASATIAGPFKQFADTFIKAFDQPAVQTAIANIAASFGLLLTAATPQLAGVVSNIATGITKMVQAVASNPQAFADFVSDLGKVAGGTLTVIASLTRVANWIEANWDWFKWIVVPEVAAIQYVVANFDTLRHDIAAHMSEIMSNTIDVWNKTWTETIGRLIQFGHEVEDVFNTIKHAISSDIDSMRGDIVNAWLAIEHFVSSAVSGIRTDVSSAFSSIKNTISNDASAFVNSIKNAFNTIVSWARGIGGRVKSAIGNLGGLLNSAGRSMINGLFNGMKAVLSNVSGWVKNNLYNPITNAVKSLFGIKSPSTVMAKLGGHLVGGLFKGILSKNPKAFITKIFGGLPSALGALIGKGLVHIEKLPASALKALGSLGGKLAGFFSSLVGGGGKGVDQWAGIVAEALALNGLPQSLSAQVLHQIATESGGNPNAINLTDSNAAMGDPSRGLLQTIGSTFAAFHIPGTSSNIYDPLANVAAAINYAKHTYGPDLMSGGMGLGSGHGYQFGTLSATKGWHMVGERGPELLGFRGGESVIPNNQLGGNSNYHVTVQVNGALSTDKDIAQAVSDGLSKFQRHGGSVPWK